MHVLSPFERATSRVRDRAERTRFRAVDLVAGYSLALIGEFRH